MENNTFQKDAFRRPCSGETVVDVQCLDQDSFSLLESLEERYLYD